MNYITRHPSKGSMSSSFSLWTSQTLKWWKESCVSISGKCNRIRNSSWPQGLDISGTQAQTLWAISWPRALSSHLTFCVWQAKSSRVALPPGDSKWMDDERRQSSELSALQGLWVCSPFAPLPEIPFFGVLPWLTFLVILREVIVDHPLQMGLLRCSLSTPCLFLSQNLHRTIAIWLPPHLPVICLSPGSLSF